MRLRKEHCSISVFFPSYNDRFSIEKLVSQAHKILEVVAKDFEIIVVDDGSTDGSQQILKELANKYPRLKLIFHTTNQGYGGALKSGFTKATGDLIFYTDGDGQYDPAEMPLLFGLMTPDVDFINGIKMVRHDPTYRVVLGNWYSFIARWLFWLPIYDVDCDFRLIRRAVVKKIELVCTSGAVCIELIKKAQQVGARFRQVSVHHFERKYGTSQFFRPKRLLVTLKELIFLWWRVVVFPSLKEALQKYRVPSFSAS